MTSITPAFDPADIRAQRVGSAPVPISVLSMAMVNAYATPADAMHGMVDLAQYAERRGFSRFWLSEFHSAAHTAGSSPPVLLAYLAAQTARIRLGSGGVMLPNHAPLVIAEQFGALEAMAPGRIDLGVGRSSASDAITADALRQGRADEGADSIQQLLQLTAFLDDAFPDGHPYGSVHAVPGVVQHRLPNSSTQPGRRPPIWMLASSPGGAGLAAQLGLPIAVAHHFAPRNTMRVLDAYRSEFQPSAVLEAPYAMVSADVMAFEDERDVVAHRKATGVYMTQPLRSGTVHLFPSLDEAAAYRFTSDEEHFLDQWNASVIAGHPSEVRAGLDQLQAATQADELILVTNVFGDDARKESFRLIADAYDFPDE